MSDNTDNKCKLCKKTLVPIGTARNNGKTTHNDWKTREYHKKCFVKIMEEKELKQKLIDRGFIKE